MRSFLPCDAGARSVRRVPVYRKADTPSRCTSALSQGPAAIERTAYLRVFGNDLLASEGGERLSIGVVLSYP